MTKSDFSSIKLIKR